MAVWSTPITWSNGALTAANLNTVRDNLVWLKAFAALITDGTADDEGNSTYLRIARASGDTALYTQRTGDTVARFHLDADGNIGWGSGSGTSDVFLQREAARILVLRDAQFRSYRDNWEDASYSSRITGDTGQRWAVYGGGFMEMKEVSTTPATPATGYLRIYARDNGSGKQQVIAKFDDGTIVSMATQA